MSLPERLKAVTEQPYCLVSTQVQLNWPLLGFYSGVRFLLRFYSGSTFVDYLDIDLLFVCSSLQYNLKRSLDTDTKVICT